jgi:uncharacterized protein (TIGR00730 family)
MPDNSTQRNAKAFVLPVADTEFLLRDELRGVRFGLEYEKAELNLRDWGVRSTVVVFGSARMPSPEQEALLPPAQRLADHSRWYQEAREFGRIVSERGGALAPEGALRDNVVATGGGPGIMEAANRGASEAGAPSIGFNITLPLEQQPNAYSTPDLTFQFHYFAMRKMHFAMRANALAIFPGGFGTIDEMFEILTLQQTRKQPPLPIVLVGAAYWREIVNFDALVAHGVVSPADLALFDFVETAEEAWASMVRRGLKGHTPPAESPGIAS